MTPIRRTSYIGLAASLWMSFAAQAVIDLQNVPSVQLHQVVPGSSLQAVEDIPDKSVLSIEYNDLLIHQNMNLPGWNSESTTQPMNQAVIEAFGVRTTKAPDKIEPGNSVFYAGKGVGRSGVWELQKDGEYFAKINGRPLKGLTIKGYGGNAGKSYQPDGSLDASEALRDTLLSKIFMEKGADAYIGALTVIRPKATGSAQANYIRLSRSSLRMNDLIDRKGQELRNTVEHLTTLLADEVGKKMTAEEFADWLVDRSARTLAHKEHAQVTASNHNKDNFGIAELVDFGEAKYQAYGYKKGYDAIGDGKSSWSSGLAKHAAEAAMNIANEYGFTAKDYSTIVTTRYAERLAVLEARDAAKVDLNTASVEDMKKIGISEFSAKRITNLRQTLAMGLLSLDDVVSTLNLVPSEEKAIWQKATVSSLRTADGHIIPTVIVREAGGTDVIRQTLGETFAEILDAGMTNEALVKSKVDEKIKKVMTDSGKLKYVPTYGDYGANVSSNLGLHYGKVISQNPTDWVEKITSGATKQVIGTVVVCNKVFGI